MPDENDITRWIQESDLDLTSKSSGYWQIPLQHYDAKFFLHLTHNQGWLHFGAELFEIDFSKIDSDSLARFYHFILDLNAKLNGVFIAEENGKLFLRHDEIFSDIDKNTFERSIFYIYKGHESIYLTLLSEANNLGIQVVDYY